MPLSPGEELDRDVWVRRAWRVGLVLALWIGTLWFSIYMMHGQGF